MIASGARRVLIQSTRRHSKFHGDTVGYLKDPRKRIVHRLVYFLQYRFRNPTHLLRRQYRHAAAVGHDPVRDGILVYQQDN